MSFDALLSRVASGENVASSELLPYLVLEEREQRARVNLLLAKAYWESGRKDNLPHAKVFIQRAWLLSKFSPKLLSLYERIHAALDDIPGIREAYKRVGIEMAARGEISQAIMYFDLWHHAYFTFKRRDQFEYDFDILECIDRLAQPHRFAPEPRSGLLKEQKIRVAYLVRGITQVGSALVKINLLFARYHDRSRVEPLFFAPEAENAILASEAGRENVMRFESHGCKLFMGPEIDRTGERALAVARMIHDAAPDVLVTSAALVTFEHYFITSLRPAPFVIGLVQGPPAQFAPPGLDGGLAWSKHPLIDCPFSCIRIPLNGDLPQRGTITPYDKGQLGIPDDAVVVASAGRYVKFQEPAFWQAVIDLLRRFPQMHYILLGAEESEIPFLSSMLSDDTRARIHFLGWRGDNYLRALCLADIVIDSFPSGGGGTLLDPLALGIPCVSLENNYLRLYDQTDWSLADEFINVPELIAPRGDFEAMKQVVGRLITDPDYRREMARRSQEYVLETRTNPERSIRQCEDAYLRFIAQGLSGKVATEARADEVEALARPLVGPASVPSWISRSVGRLRQALRFGDRVLDRLAENRILRRKSL